jgi:hypothetical protein
MIILGGNFDAGVCLGVGLNFFYVVYVCTRAHDVQRRVTTTVPNFRASGSLDVGRGSPNRGPWANCYVVCAVYRRLLMLYVVYHRLLMLYIVYHRLLMLYIVYHRLLMLYVVYHRLLMLYVVYHRFQMRVSSPFLKVIQ